MIQKKNLEIKILNEISKKDVELLTDWKLYQIILFNFIQNSVKYNTKYGSIKIQFSLTTKEDHSLEYVTNIIDTGKGIEPQRV